MHECLRTGPSIRPLIGAHRSRGPGTGARWGYSTSERTTAVAPLPPCGGGPEGPSSVALT